MQPVNSPSGPSVASAGTATQPPLPHEAMASWAETLGQLRIEYARASRAALDRLARLLDRLASDPADSAALEELMQCFHSYAGSGATYGFAGVSDIGAEGEKDTCALLAARRRPNPSQLARWKDLLDRLRKELGAADPSSPAAIAGEGAAAIPPEGAHRVAPTELGPATRERAAGARILSVEDDPQQAKFINAVLEQAGYEVKSCADPARFAAELDSFQPDLVLMDIVLPGTTGHELVRSLRQDSRLTILPVLFLTTQGQMNARLESTFAGGDDHLVKPLTPAALLSAVAARLERNSRVKLLLDHDELTHLLTRTAFLDRVRAAVAEQRLQPQRRASWVMFEIDEFESIVERHGQPAGDRLLVSVASLLRRHLQPGDSASRYERARFAVLLGGGRRNAATRLIDGLREEFAATQQQSSGRGAFHASFTAGVADLAPAMTVEEWRAAANRALQAAKAAVGGRAQGRPAGRAAFAQLFQLARHGA
jgi:diguanylate cyclase (GGDEF)-like protein